MISINKVIIAGHVGSDPEIRATKDGGKFAVLSVATHQHYKSKDNERVERTEWHNITVFKPNLVTLIEENVGKGDEIYVAGSLIKSGWVDKSGGEKSQMQIQVRDIDHIVRFQRRAKEELPKVPNKKTKTKKSK